MLILKYFIAFDSEVLITLLLFGSFYYISILTFYLNKLFMVFGGFCELAINMQPSGSFSVLFLLNK